MAMETGSTPPPTRTARTEAKREAVIETAMRSFAENGYQGARIEDIAGELGIAKGSIFQYFGSKEGLFLEVYKKAVSMLPAWLDAPKKVVDKGFFATLRHWLEQTEHLMREDWIPTRVTLIGNYGTDLSLKREINRFLAEDPYGTIAFVDFGLTRGEIRDDIEREMLVSMIDWMNERFQDSIVSEELDPGLFSRGGETAVRRKVRIEQFMELIHSAIARKQA